MRRLADPFVSSVLALAMLGVAGLVVVVLAWRGVAPEVSVEDQVPFLVSGGIGGLALIGFAAGVLMIQHRRFLEAQRRAEFEDVIRGAAGLLAAVGRDETVIDR